MNEHDIEPDSVRFCAENSREIAGKQTVSISIGENPQAALVNVANGHKD
jgi:hypothetical protein